MGEEKCVTEYIYGNELRTFSFWLEIKWKTFVKLLKVCINKYTYIKKIYIVHLMLTFLDWFIVLLLRKILIFNPLLKN